jgi:hypothetical protein
MSIKLNSVQRKYDYDTDNNKNLTDNILFNRGCIGWNNCWVNTEYAAPWNKLIAVLLRHCREATANSMFIFFDSNLVVCGCDITVREEDEGTPHRACLQQLLQNASGS